MARSLFHHTPSIKSHDPRQLPVRQVEYLRQVAGGPTQALVTRQQHDPSGRLVMQLDPRRVDGTSPPNLQTVYNLSAQPLRIDSVDAGGRLVLPGPAGEERQRWDARGNHWHFRHDALLRRLVVTENAHLEIERNTYADHTADAGHNLRGELNSLSDPSGSAAFSSYGLAGQVLSETRHFIDTLEPFTTLRHYGPQGDLLLLTDAGGHRQLPRYDIAGQLLQLSLELAGASAAEPVMCDSRYNAAGQLVEQLAGNGVRSHHFYDPADGRLLRMLARRDQAAALQNLYYFFDLVGNILRIEDHTLATVYFANQRVDGDRHFAYDSLYRLIESRGFEGQVPQQLPGLPQPIQPIDPGRRFNYTEHYLYDVGNNLVELQHVREGHNFTQQMRIDPRSNRGVRWKTGDPEPDFAEHFDPLGNQLQLQPGTVPLRWSNQNQLARVTLLQHENGLPDDEEVYRYSQGARVYKRWLSHTASATHRREVRYLPGLEIHARSDGQQLHVIVLPGARCLHWLSGRPLLTDNNQLRYSLDDHLGSCALELDRHADVISLEHYYPFGGTAWWAVRSALEASYKTIRYSGREMDASGLYYYGARYYAPWLQRWVSADPAGAVDGLNLYAFVSNNPVIHVDQAGASKVIFDLVKRSIGLFDKAKTATDQLHNLSREFDGLVPENADIEDLRKNMTLGKFLKSRHGIKSVLYGAGKGAAIGSVLGTALPGIGNAIGTGVGILAGVIVFPLLRYYFFKKGLRLAQTLRTQELKDGLQTVGDTVTRMVDGATDLLNSSTSVLEGIKTVTNTLNGYPGQIQTLFHDQLQSLAGDKQREVIRLLRTGIDPFDAISKVLETAQDVNDAPNVAENLNDRLQQLQGTVTEPSRPKPVPKPRTKFLARASTGETFV